MHDDEPLCPLAWQQCKAALAWLGVVVAGLGAGCVPDDLPAYTPERDAVIVISDQAPSNEGHEPNAVIGMVRMKDNHYQAVPNPPGGTLGQSRPGHRVRLINNEVWAEFRFPKTPNDDPSENWRHVLYRLDRKTQTFVPAPADLKESGLTSAILISHQGAPCWAIRTADRDNFKLLKRDNLQALGKLKLSYPIAAGNGWWLRMINSDNWDPDSWELVDPQAKVATRITRAEIIKSQEFAKHMRGGVPQYACISQDDRVVGILSTMQNMQRQSFGIFDATRGNCLWASEDCCLHPGTPRLSQTELWTLDQAAVEPATALPNEQRENEMVPRELQLVHYTAGEPAASGLRRASKAIVMRYPLGKGRQNLLGNYTLAPDGREFLVVANSQPPRLLLVPISEKTKRTDVRVVALK